MTLVPEELGQSGQELAALLKELRLAADLTGERLAKRCNLSQSTISRYETGAARPPLVAVEQILRAVEAPPSVVAEVSALARMANTEWRNVRELRRKGLGSRQAELKALETSSGRMRYFLLSMLTGLLATPEYVRASLAHSPADTSKAVAGKLERQQILYDTTKQFTFILTEQAARFPLIPHHAMAVQLDRLASLTHLPNVSVGIIPTGTALPSLPLNSFTVYDSTMATVELSTGSIVFRDPRDVQTYVDAFEGYERCAIFADSARDLLAVWASSLRS